MDHIFIKDGYEQYKIRFDEILFLEAAGNYVTFSLVGKKVVTRSTLQEAIDLLPSHLFLRIHRSYILSLSKNDKVKRHQVTIKAKKIPVSSAYREYLFKSLSKTRDI